MYGEHDYEVLTSSREGLQRQEDHFGSKQRHDTDGYNIIPFGYCTYRNRSDDGKFAFNINTISEKAIVSKFYPVFRFTNANSTFMAEFLNSSPRVKKKLSVLAVGTSQVVLSFEALKAAKFDLPCKDEQDRIAAFLECLNTRIENQRTLVVALKKYKRGAVAHILSGKSKAFTVTSSWTEHTLSELCSEFRSGRNISAALIHQSGNYPVYGGNGIRGYCNQYSHDGEYVVVGRQGALCGNVRLIQGKNYLSEHAIAVQANEANETKFLLYLLDYMKLGQYSDQGAQPGLAVNKLLRLKCMVPDKQTQIRIASFLMSFDFQISTQERVLMLLNTQRRALLQRLFI